MTFAVQIAVSRRMFAFFTDAALVDLSTWPQAWSNSSAGSRQKSFSWGYSQKNMVTKRVRIQPLRESILFMRDVVHACWQRQDMVNLMQMHHFCHHGDIICHPNSSYVTNKLYGTSACGCNNKTIFQNELFSRFLPSTLAGKVSHSYELNLVDTVDIYFLLFKISFLPMI